MANPGGEGAVSTGPMVPIHDARSEADARAVVRLLEAHEIPAMLDRELAGMVTPFSGGKRPGASRVFVPLAMARTARSLLSRHETQGLTDPGRAARGRSNWPVGRGGSPLVLPAPSVEQVEVPPPLPPPVIPVIGPFSEEPFAAPEEEEDDDEEPFGIQLPEASPVQGRLSVALAALAFGIGGQRILEAFFGDGGRVRALFGAHAPVLEQPWRLATASFLHGGFGHLASNAAFGLMIGVVLFGTHLVGATALTWVISSMVGIAAEATFTPGALVIGASAGNYGLVGLWAHGQLQRSRVSLFPRREQVKTVGLLLLLVPGALTPFSSTGTRIAVLAHAVGFVVGFLCGYAFERRLLPGGFPEIERRSRWAGGVALAVIAAAVLSAARSLFV